MLKKDKAILESLTRKYGRRNVEKSINESGDTHRGQYMLGRLANRQSERGERSTAHDKAYTMAGNNYSDDYIQGFDDEAKYRRNADSTWSRDNYNRIKFNYDTKEMQDMDELGKKFINFIEKYEGGMLLQTIVDYESGNETGEPQSPLGEIIPYFEEEVLGYECSPKMKKAIKSAYNQWWFYAEAMLMPEEDYDEIDESYRPRKNRKMLKEGGHIYVKNDDGTIFTNSKNTWRGVKGTTFIWHGEWADPEILYDGEELNASQLEDYAWDVYKTECIENDKTPNEREFDNLPTKWFKDVIDDYMFGMFADQY